MLAHLAGNVGGRLSTDDRYRLYSSDGRLLGDGLTIDQARESQRRWNSTMRHLGVSSTAEIRRLIVYEVPSE